MQRWKNKETNEGRIKKDWKKNIRKQRRKIDSKERKEDR